MSCTQLETYMPHISNVTYTNRDVRHVMCTDTNMCHVMCVDKNIHATCKQCSSPIYMAGNTILAELESLFINVTWPIRMCYSTRLYVWHDSLCHHHLRGREILFWTEDHVRWSWVKCVTWLINVNRISGFPCLTWEPTNTISTNKESCSWVSSSTFKFLCVQM